jgi:hypothetical protein
MAMRSAAYALWRRSSPPEGRTSPCQIVYGPQDPYDPASRMFLFKAGTSNPDEIATHLNRKTTLRARELLWSIQWQRKIR